VKRILVEPKWRRHGETGVLLTKIDYGGMHEFAHSLDEKQRYHIPLSEHLFSVVRDPLRRVLPDDAEYEEAFDRFELLRALAYAHLKYTTLGENDRCWVPLGRYCWKADRRAEESTIKQFHSELEEAGSEWPPLKAGMLNGSVDRARELIAAITRFIATLQMW
jgi:hypothetical protein